MNDWTICGFCHERITDKDRGRDSHGCAIIQSLKKSFNEALRAIQHDFNYRQDVLISRIHTLEANKGAANVIINSMHENFTKRLAKVEKEFELLKHPKIKVRDLNAKDGSQPCVKEYVETQGNNIRVVYKFADGRLDTIEKQDVHHPSRQHLEKTLAAKNQRIKELEEQLGRRNGECQNALNEANNAKSAYARLLESWQSLNRTVLELKIHEDKYKSKSVRDYGAWI